MNVLVVNSGSSSIKFQIIETDISLMQQDADRRVASGVVERIGGHALITLNAEGYPPLKFDQPVKNSREAIELVLRRVVSSDSRIDSIQSVSDIHGVGHRVVHGGERFKASIRIDEDVIKGIEECIDLAPLHNPANLKGIRAVKEILGAGVPQVAVFDTAFHSTMPEVSYLYGIPYHLYRSHKIRRYGFHGTSHRYIACRYRKALGLEPEQVNIITVHLGNGCSACAIKNGESYDTSMGFTPLEGLLMGTRCGDLDPSVVGYLAQKEGLSLYEIEALLNRQSGLLGLSGLTGDMRDLLAEEEEHDDRRAKLAIDVFCQRVRKYIGAYYVALENADAVVFTGGIGENSAPVRKRICSGLRSIGVELDLDKNEQLKPGETAEITTPTSRTKVYVAPTDEELLIARDTVRVITGEMHT